MESDHSGILGQLAQHLLLNPLIRFFHTMDLRYRDIHLKDLVVSAMDDQRRMTVQGTTVYNFGSDSFLGLDRDARVQQALLDGVQRWGTHNGASRAFYSVQANAEAERKLAHWLGVEATLIFPSVTLVNTGLLPGLVRRGDLLAVDRLAHNSIHEGAKIAQANGAEVQVFHPCTPETLQTLLRSTQYNQCLVAVDGVYSMQGTTPPLRELDEVTRAHGGVLYVDDAHGTGIVGDHGRGAAMQELGTLQNVIMVGSLSKAFSCMGAFVTCTEDLKQLFKMASSTYVFGGPVPPPYLEAIGVVCDILMSDEYEAIIARLRARIRLLVEGLHALDLAVLGGDAPIVAVLVKDRTRALQAGKWLFDHGFYVQSVAYPAVPVNAALLRIQVNANHPLQAIEGLLEALGHLRQVVALPTAADLAESEGAPVQRGACP
ncbi:MAG TPA: pyridoxal phosphate-dependent aminotransferase family protein [Candidatus Saccharimonadia bacterium]|nr:pyridoxal phosphate-dependent aminotransferase family protein [Candidatus Saccharimonadia bacterium]